VAGISHWHFHGRGDGLSSRQVGYY